MFKVSPRYMGTSIKLLDGIKKGSSSLWSARALKIYGCLSPKLEHNIDFKDDDLKFNYTDSQIAVAKKLRATYYEKLFNSGDIDVALQYNPMLSADIEIFSSIDGDIESVITLPDEDDVLEDFSHSINILGTSRYSQENYLVYTNWPKWGNNGYGEISKEYINRHLITSIVFDQFGIFNKTKFKRKRIVINNKKWTLAFREEISFKNDKRKLYNYEVYSVSGTLAGWIHIATENKILEIQDLYILEEYRKMGIASFLLNKMIDEYKPIKIDCFITSYDIIGSREEVVKGFFLKNNFLTIPERKRFKECRLRIEKL